MKQDFSATTFFGPSVLHSVLPTFKVLILEFSFFKDAHLSKVENTVCTSLKQSSGTFATALCDNNYFREILLA